VRREEDRLRPIGEIGPWKREGRGWRAGSERNVFVFTITIVFVDTCGHFRGSPASSVGERRVNVFRASASGRIDILNYVGVQATPVRRRSIAKSLMEYSASQYIVEFRRSVG